jgi:hypothetical protein
MKLGEISISPDNQLDLNLVEDLSDTEVRLGDFIRLRGLQVGMILYLRNDGSGQKIIFVGNGTPGAGTTEACYLGWDWKLYNHWVVNRVLYLQPQLNGSFLNPEHVRQARQIVDPLTTGDLVGTAANIRDGD